MRTLSRRRINLIGHVLCFALLFAQLGAVVHAYSHFVGDPPGAPPSVESCGTCLSFAPLLSAVGGPSCLPAVDACQAERIDPVTPILIPYRPPFPAFQPRAPPELL